MVGHLAAPLASIHWMPVASPFLGYNNQKCFRKLQNVPRGEGWEQNTIPLVGNHWLEERQEVKDLNLEVHQHLKGRYRNKNVNDLKRRVEERSVRKVHLFREVT